MCNLSFLLNRIIITSSNESIPPKNFKLTQAKVVGMEKEKPGKQVMMKRAASTETPWF